MKTIQFNKPAFMALLIAMLVLIAVGAAAQANRATITGTVTDTSGAIVPGVEVSATNQGTNISAKTVSNQDGIYVIPNLAPGAYSLEFRKEGFGTVARPSVTLESTEVARIDVSMKVGAVNETVTVTTDAPVLELERPTEGTNMKASVINELPLSIYGGGRFVETFAVDITPGYSIYSSPYGAVINGGQWFTKDYTVDGSSGTGDIPGNSMQNGPTMEAVQELQAQTSGLDAESSITGGGVITMSLKSGTNQLHGSALLYGANEFFDANTWGNTAEKSKRRAWDYAFSLGGPIIKNKTFFFGAFERYTQVDRRLGDYSSFVPTASFLGGDFSALLGSQLCTQPDSSVAPDCTSAGTTPISVMNDAGQAVPLQEGMIFDPTTGNQFTGNMIDPSRFSSVAKTINAIYQKSYVPEGPGLITPNNRLPLSNSPTQTPNEAVVKLDHVLTQKDHLSGSWIYDHKPRTLVDSGGVWESGSTDGGPLSAARNNFFRSHQFRASESHTFTPSMLNILNFTYNYDWQGDEPSAAGSWTSQLGFGNTGAGNFPIISFDNPQVGDNNSFSETYIGNSFQGDFSGANIITGDTVTWNKGRHSLTFGGDFTAHQVNSHAGSGALAFNFANNTTGAPSQGYAQYVGFGFASYLLGDVNTASETTPYNLYGRQKAMSLFVQDSYKVTSKLTLDLGLRWDYTFRFHEKYGHWANFDLTQISPTYGIPGDLVFAKGGGDSFEKDEYATNFGPQLGFAYSPLKKLVLRGAFGIIYNPVGVAYFQGTPNGFAPGFKGINQVSSPFDWDSGYPGVFQPGNQNVDPTLLFPDVTVDPRALRVGYSDTFNVGAQYELTPNMRVELAYIANRGHRLTDTSLAWNEGPTSTFLRLGQQNPDLNGFNHYVCSQADATSYGVNYPYAGFCGPVLSAIAAYPQLAQAESNYWYYPNLLYVGLPLGQSYYDSVVVDVVKRTGRGLTMDMSYTWSRQEGDTYTAQQEGNGYYTAIQDFSNLGVAAHSLTGYDLTHVVKGYVTYELPFGKGRRWMANQNRWINGALGGWNTTWLLKYNTGQPFMISAQNPYWPQWGNIYPDFNLSGFKGPNNPRQFPTQTVYMPSTVATQPAVGQLGTGPLAINALRCPGSQDEDASLLKYFPMGPDGRYRLSFRAEFYNVFNRHFYDIVGCGGTSATIGAGNFGVINGVNSNPRQGQFGFHFEF